MIQKILTRRAKRHKLKHIFKNAMVKKIQKKFRNYSNNLLNKDEESMRNNSVYKNNSSITGLELNEINNKYFYKHSGYFFDIRELEGVDKHPYTTVEFTVDDKKQIKRILYYLKSNYYYYRELNEEGPELSEEERYTAYKTDVFKKIEENGVYLSVNIFDNFNHIKLHIFLQILFTYDLIRNVYGIRYYLNDFKNTFYKNLCGNINLRELQYKTLYILSILGNIDDEFTIPRCLIIRRCLRPIDIIDI